ncbi:tRNA (adenosine(37)-N6)-threonylcarbamoyltransferase complex transferase subunit TsaD [Campylobacter sp. RM12651]|uniref:tRNA (adenosine(37)-N6)-threonylcarbamoyltransferase complex transferase subunit TsaD n=1 Tax=Campylobacter sp. RM12651 TaxID=1660079 RepID=UPI001EFB01CB|nr:tRNA (adenosine(37)-N6)-threonylcarbamoyltransferase complex transferase subunit TsaD [Campylobacter sp. RM12651]ULO03487.1 N6-L-threonylcarbamoyladenine synthase, TsaD subunit [Campylobacter sp. RM12651]
MRELLLAIESSCDDSSIAVIDVNTYECLFYEKISQDEHNEFGGVVPELASRLHTEALPKILAKTKPFLNELKAIAVTNEPGLSVSLQSGVAMAKALSVALNIPLIAINHLKGHICSLFLDKEIMNDFLVLLVSGGHTMILEITKEYDINLIATTSDDSFGESFDKVAKMLGLGYPGGVFIEELAKNESNNTYEFSLPIPSKSRLEYSFSGIKNQVRLAINDCIANNTLDTQKANIAAAFQRIACKHIINKLNIVLHNKNYKALGVVGGASANLLLRSKLDEICKKNNMQLLLAPLKYCSDNALMIARAGVIAYKNKDFVNISDDIINPKSKNFKRL